MSSAARSAETASEWYRRWSAGGKQALRGAGRAGRLPRLDADQLARVERALLAGPTANGFPTELWTLPRIAQLVEAKFAVKMVASSIWRLLGRLGWSVQRPAGQARERDERAVRTWK